MFSVPCSETQLNLNIKKITKYCYDLKKTDSGRNVSNRDGWQSTELFFPNSLSNLADKICEVGSKIFYALDGSDTYTSLGSITTNGVTEYDFPSTAAPAGLEFKSIRFKFTFRSPK